MIFEQYSVLALLLVIVTTLLLVVIRDWRWTLLALGVQYIGVTWLAATHLPFSMALIKLVVGWMSAAVIGITLVGTSHSMDEITPVSWRLFRLTTGGLAILVVFSVAPGIAAWLPGVSLEVTQAGLILAAGGLLQLGMSVRPFRVAVGLLTTLSGFELLYAGVEVSVLVTGLLAVVNLGLALAGAYMLTLTQAEGRA